jgi:hypothetical protein
MSNGGVILHNGGVTMRLGMSLTAIAMQLLSIVHMRHMAIHSQVASQALETTSMTWIRLCVDYLLTDIC